MTTPATQKGPSKERIPVFDGIRGLCALAVVLGHVTFTTMVLPSAAGPPKEGFWSILAAGNDMAIGPFFVMSGLFLFRPFVRRALAGTKYPNLGHYFARRAARLIPAMWLLALACLLVLNFSSIDSAWFFLRPFALLQVYDFQYYAGLDVAWTVPTEAQFYMALPILAAISMLFAKFGKTTKAKARWMLAPLALLVPLQLIWVGYVHENYVNWPPQFFYPFGMTGALAIGMAFAVWTVRSEVSPADTPRIFNYAKQHPNHFWIGLLILFVVSCLKPFAKWGVADWLTWEAAVVQSAMFLIFAYLVMMPLIVPGATSRLMKAVLGNPVSVYLGRISYGLYLWHFPVMYIIFESGTPFGTQYQPVQLLLGKFGFWELFIPTLLGTIAVASVSYYLFERPIINFVGRKTATKRAAPPAPPTIIGGDPGLPKAA